MAPSPHTVADIKCSECTKVQNYIYTSKPMGFRQRPMFMLESIWRAAAVGLVRVSREEQEREGLRAVGMGTWRKAIPEVSLPPAVEM